mgnify:CR=1 FL=1
MPALWRPSKIRGSHKCTDLYKVWQSAVRGHTVNKAPDTSKLNRQLSAQQHLIDKLKAVRALHIVAYNSDHPIEKVAVELFYVLGDVLEGQGVKDLALHRISKEEVLREYQDG